MTHRATTHRSGRRGLGALAGATRPVHWLAAAVVLAVLVTGAFVITVRPTAQPSPQAPAPAPQTTSAPPAAAPAPLAAPAPPHAPAPAPPDPPSCDPLAEIARMPLRRQLAQLVMVGVDPSGPAQARRLVATEQVGGIFIGGTATGLLTGDALAQVQEVAEIPVTVAVDDEGGRVQRLDDLVGSLPSARQMAATLGPAQVERLARERGAELRARGVTMNMAPTVDVSDQPLRAVIGDRSFAADPEVVVRYADAFARGLRQSGVLPVFKHFPGHGRAAGDSHAGRVSTPPLGELLDLDLVPYRKLLGSGADAVMVGHLDVPGLTAPQTPASISPEAITMLRRDLGYRGLVLTDDLGAMRAITDRVALPEAVRRALAAGVDMALWTSRDAVGPVLDHLERSVATGALPPTRVQESVLRVLHTKGIDPCQAP